MPEPVVPTPADAGAEAEVDAFGADINPPEPPKEEPKEGEKKKKGTEDSPEIVALKGEVEKIKKEYGTNLSGQRTVIERLEKEIADLKGGKKDDKGGAPEDVLFPADQIKWSKDLTEEQREEMTETEIKQMDELAAMKTAQNKMYSEMRAGKKGEGEKKVEDLNNLVQSTARELSKGKDGAENTDLANEIIESFKAMKFNTEGLSEKEIKERVAIAAGQVPNYKPPKEQPHKRGGAVKAGTDTDDPFGNNKIVEEATKGGDGGYAL